MSHLSDIARAGASLVLGLALSTPSWASRADDLFDFGGASGYAPWAGVIVNEKGVLFGSTTIGGTGPCFGGAGCGTLYSLTPPAAPSLPWQFEVLYEFQGGRDGQGPQAPLTLGPHGEVFGYTTGGTSGTVFRLLPPDGARQTWQYDILYVFKGGTDGDLTAVEAPLVARAGVLYGIASGGAGSCDVNVHCGSVFRIKQDASGAWVKRTLHTFKGRPGRAGMPTWIVADDDTGALIVSTQWQGGHVLRLSPPAGGQGRPWDARIIAAFDGGGFGKRPSHLVEGAGGTVYGVSASEHGSGLVFELVPPGIDGGTWVRSVIAKVSIHQYGPDWLAAGTQGSLVGTVFGDFDFYPGAVFRLVPPGGGRDAWSLDWIWSFTHGPDRNPTNVVTGPGGHLFGILSGGDSTNGSVFELHPN